MYYILVRYRSIFLHRALLAVGQSFGSESIISSTVTLYAESFISFTFGQNFKIEEKTIFNAGTQAVFICVWMSFQATYERLY